MAKTSKPRVARKRRNKQPDRSEERRQRIAEAAYYKAERRGFAPGREADDWLEAELEVDAESAAD